VPDALDRLVSSSETGPVEELSVAELRARRNHLQGTEQSLSYLRRLVQGRLDIVADELHHRVEGDGSRDLSALVHDLPKILSEHVSGGARGSLPQLVAPSADLDGCLADLDRIIGPDRLGSLSELDDGALADLAVQLTALERRVSQHRRSLHAAIDALQEEIVRRYKTGEASVDNLLP